MTRIPYHRMVASLLCCASVLAACGTSSDTGDVESGGSAQPSVALAEPIDTTSPTTPSPPATTATEPSEPAATIVADEAWRDGVAAMCRDITTAMFAIGDPSSPDDVTRFIGDHVPAHDELVNATAKFDLPEQLTAVPYDIPTLVDQADDWMTLSLDQITDANIDGDEFSNTAVGSIDFFRHLLSQIWTVYTIAGVPCGLANPARAAEAALNVPILTAWQVSTAFDSVWVSDRANRQVHRIDPQTGEEQAIIDVGTIPVRLQPADGRMVVRTVDAYEFIDPTTNSVTDTLPKADVGPSANRAWAVDGALWICDGQRLHRYDPATLQSVAVIELGFECGNVHASADVAIPWSFNEDPGDTGTSTAALVDPATNMVKATIDLPVDVGKPTIIDERIFFPANEGSTSVVIDRASGTITSTPDLGRPYAHTNDSAFDGTYLYVMVEGRDIAVVDPVTFEIVDTIEPMDFDPPLGVQLNALALGDGALWVVNDESSILQRFDI